MFVSVVVVIKIKRVSLAKQISTTFLEVVFVSTAKLIRTIFLEGSGSKYS